MSNKLTTLDELKVVLENWRRPSLNELGQDEFKLLLSGFRIIVKGFEEKQEIQDISIQWLHIYLEIHALATKSESKLKLFLETFPITLTYIIGWLQHGPNDSTKFLSEILYMTNKLVNLVDGNELKKFEQYQNGIIASLWQILNVTGTYDLQFQVLLLISLLLKNLSKDYQHIELNEMVYEDPDEIKYLLIEFIQLGVINNKYRKLARKILNIHNKSLKKDALILSFHCKCLYLGKNIKLTKPTYYDHLWFDINLKENTLNCEGREALIGSRKYCNVNVSLKPAKISIGLEKIIIQFETPAEIIGLQSEIEADNLQNIELAYIEQISKTEIKRFENSILACDFGKSRIQDNIDFQNNNHVLFDFVARHNNLKEQIEFSEGRRNSSMNIRSHLKMQKEPFNIASEEEQEVSALNSPEVYDEYNNFYISDAEPCQSYKNFKTNRPELFEDIKPTPIKEETKKPSLSKTKSIKIKNKKQKKVEKTFDDELNFEAGTSKKSTYKRKIVKKSAEKPKNGVSSSKKRRLSLNTIIDLSEESFETNNSFETDLTALKNKPSSNKIYDLLSAKKLSSDDENNVNNKIKKQRRTNKKVYIENVKVKIHKTADTFDLTQEHSDDETDEDEPLSKYLKILKSLKSTATSNLKKKKHKNLNMSQEEELVAFVYQEHTDSDLSLDEDGPSNKCLLPKIQPKKDIKNSLKKNTTTLLNIKQQQKQNLNFNFFGNDNDDDDISIYQKRSEVKQQQQQKQNLKFNFSGTDNDDDVLIYQKRSDNELSSDDDELI